MAPFLNLSLVFFEFFFPPMIDIDVLSNKRKTSWFPPSLRPLPLA